MEKTKQIPSIELKDFKWMDFTWKNPVNEPLWLHNIGSVINIISKIDKTDINLIIFIGKHRKKDIYEISGISNNWVICKIAKIRRNEYLYFFRRCGTEGIDELSLNEYKDYAKTALRLDRKSGIVKGLLRGYYVNRLGIVRNKAIT